LSRKAPIQLDWEDKDGKVTITPKDQDRYLLGVRTIIERAQYGREIELFSEQLTLLQRELATWLKGRDDLSQAFLTMRDGGLFFLVVKKDAKYSESLEDELSDLDIQLANDDLLNLPVDVLALPNASADSIDTFLDSVFAVSFL